MREPVQNAGSLLLSESIMKFDNLINNIEILLELEQLRKIGLSEEEIAGYFEFYAESWTPSVSVPNEN